MNNRRFRLAVLSPFVDKLHGTERNVAEWINRLADTFEIHLYSQDVRDIDLSRITWHKIPKLPGPHLLNYLWWFVANHLWRSWDRRFRNLRPHLIFSPGINCLDADVISVHVVFAKYLHQNSRSLRFADHSLSEWPRLIHRKLYYKLVAQLERRLYRDPRTQLILISRRTGEALESFYGRHQKFPVVYQGLDHQVFNPERRLQLRDAVRGELGFVPGEFVLLLVANDWQNKGLPVLLEVMARLRDLPMRLLVVGEDDPSPYREIIEQKFLTGRVDFLPTRPDVEFYYSAADAYCGPSWEDAFGQPPAEAMACGLPIITAVTCGVSELVSSGEDGLVLQDPSDADGLASWIRQLYQEPAWRDRLGQRAAQKMRQFTWERNGREMTEILLKALEKKTSLAGLPLRQEV
ncbi:MAG TPA: glycosyltransferase family 4 protein [Candidatus Acidoferrales bacterium]|nr:glycosyltransferase family 4 protein [Candidatus Acidoferrales bacterium]